MSGMRDLARRFAPARSVVRRLRKAAKGPPIFETELGDYRLRRDPDPRPRLNLVIPSLDRAGAFGGVSTGVEIFCRLGARLGEGWDLRALTANPEVSPPPASADNVLSSAAPAAGLDPAAVEQVARRTRGTEIATRAGDVFLAYNWHCAINLRALLAAQAAEFGVAARPLIYLVQEYEPGFFPFSADHLLMREAYADDWPVIALINSAELAAHLAALGHRFAESHVFAPRMPGGLRPFLKDVPTATRRKRILIYGRPLENRNCFPILRRALPLWAARHPEQRAWEAVSVGAPHPPVPLGDGREWRSAGKLTLPGYAAMLCESAVGVSLMASPHPSYPPLEMAHFGLRTLTNRFSNKDLSQAHDNIESLASARPEALAEAIAAACAAFEADPGAGARGRSHLEGYLGDDPWPFMGELAARLVERVG